MKKAALKMTRETAKKLIGKKWSTITAKEKEILGSYDASDGSYDASVGSLKNGDQCIIDFSNSPLSIVGHYYDENSECYSEPDPDAEIYCSFANIDDFYEYWD